MHKLVPLAVSVLLAIGASGCTTTETRPGAKNPETVTRSINLAGYPPDFQKGFKEGCDVARSGGSRSAKPKGDGQYAVGWNDGYDYCSPKK